MQNDTIPLENSLQFLIKLNIHLGYDPAISLPGIYPRKMKTCVHTKTWMQAFPVTLFLIPKDLKPKCPPTGERINKLCHIHLMGNF